jgi:hypothetical protein
MVRTDLIIGCVPIHALDASRLHNEFPELVAATQSGAGPTTIVEVGCGK